MKIQNLFGDTASEPTLQEILSAVAFFLSGIYEKMPRIDTNDRLIVSHAESNPSVSITASQTLATVTTLTSLGTNSAVANSVPYNLSNTGALHIYNNIEVL